MSERKRAVLEVIALGVEDAVAAQAGGADRLELVTDMAADGLTPAVETFVGIPLRRRHLAARDAEAGGRLRGGRRQGRRRARTARGGDAGRRRGQRVRARFPRRARAVPTCPPWSGSSRELDDGRTPPLRDIRPRRRPRLPAQAARGPAGPGRVPHGGFPGRRGRRFPDPPRRGRPPHRTRLRAPDHGGRRAASRSCSSVEGRADRRLPHRWGAARPGGWDGPVAAAAVREWRQALDA